MKSLFDIQFKRINNVPGCTKQAYQVINYTKNVIGDIRYHIGFDEYIFNCNTFTCLFDKKSLDEISRFLKELNKEDLK